MNPNHNLLINSVPIEVTYLDGTKETVCVKSLTIRELAIFTGFIGTNNTPGLVALCVGRPPEWVDTLEDDSYRALAPKCIQLNFSRAIGISRDDPVAAVDLVPYLLKLDKLIQSAAPRPTGEHGNSSSPTPAPVASAEVIGSASSI